MSLDKTAPGVYVTVNDLVRLQHQATGFSFLPRQPVHSLLSGRHNSRLRGRGLDFEELRQYQPGDDIRTMDWKASKRTRRPYVRVFSEERERPVLLIVDQRMSMFFGSQVNMKSVTAAEAAALAAWRVVNSGDKIGAVVFNDETIQLIKPLCSKKNVMQMIQCIVEQNNALSVELDIRPKNDMLNQALERALKVTGHDYLVCVVSDFSGLSHKTLQHVKQLARHNDVMLMPVYDPLAKALPEKTTIVIGNGSSQILLDANNNRLKKRFPEFLKGRLKTLTENLNRFGVPVLPIHTAEPVALQVRRILGLRPGRRQYGSGHVAIRGSR